jgi:hypothetical protein
MKNNDTFVFWSNYGVTFVSFSIILARPIDIWPSVALVNHLYPYKLYPSFLLFLMAKVYVFETSDPPFFYVIHCPDVQG